MLLNSLLVALLATAPIAVLAAPIASPGPLASPQDRAGGALSGLLGGGLLGNGLYDDLPGLLGVTNGIEDRNLRLKDKIKRRGLLDNAVKTAEETVENEETLEGEAEDTTFEFLEGVA